MFERLKTNKTYIMQNLSGEAKNWLPEEKTTTKMVVPKKKKVTIKLTSEIKKLETINSSLYRKYNQAADKNILDAIMSLDTAIYALENIN